MTTKQEIGSWFDAGVTKKSAFMIVVCDTFDHDDYPVYVESASDCLTKIKTPGEMQRVMEVYDLTKDKDEQLSEQRAWNIPKDAK
jgi:hypothetical protein